MIEPRWRIHDRPVELVLEPSDSRYGLGAPGGAGAGAAPRRRDFPETRTPRRQPGPGPAPVPVRSGAGGGTDKPTASDSVGGVPVGPYKPRTDIMISAGPAPTRAGLSRRGDICRRASGATRMSMPAALAQGRPGPCGRAWAASPPAAPWRSCRPLPGPPAAPWRRPRAGFGPWRRKATGRTRQPRPNSRSRGRHDAAAPEPPGGLPAPPRPGLATPTSARGLTDPGTPPRSPNERPRGPASRPYAECMWRGWSTGSTGGGGVTEIRRRGDGPRRQAASARGARPEEETRSCARARVC